LEKGGDITVHSKQLQTNTGIGKISNDGTVREHPMKPDPSLEWGAIEEGKKKTDVNQLKKKVKRTEGIQKGGLKKTSSNMRCTLGKETKEPLNTQGYKYKNPWL